MPLTTLTPPAPATQAAVQALVGALWDDEMARYEDGDCGTVFPDLVTVKNWLDGTDHPVSHFATVLDDEEEDDLDDDDLDDDDDDDDLDGEDEDDDDDLDDDEFSDDDDDEEEDDLDDEEDDDVLEDGEIDLTRLPDEVLARIDEGEPIELAMEWYARS
jgi:hypothetical protein